MSDCDLGTIHLEEYCLVSAFSRGRHVHGGSAVFARRELSSQCKALPTLKKYCVEMAFECSGLIYDGDTCIVCIYRSNVGELQIFLGQLSLILAEICNKYRYIFVCGDFNIDHLRPEKAEYKALQEVLEPFNLFPVMNAPSRVATVNGITSVSTLDYIVTNIPGESLFNTFQPGLSDHHAQTVRWRKKLVHEHVFSRIPYRVINADALGSFGLMLTQRLSSGIIVDSDNIDDIFSSFGDQFYYCFNAAFPRCSKMVRCCNSVGKVEIDYSEGVKEGMRLLEVLSTIKTATDNTHISMGYKILKKRTSEMIKRERIDYFENKINTSNNKSRTMWSIVNKLQNKITLPKKVCITGNNGVTLTDPVEVANAFGIFLSCTVRDNINNHFGRNLSGSCTLRVNHDRSMFFHPIVDEEVASIVQRLPNKKSSGFDEVPVSVVKSCVGVLSPILADIMNKSIVAGQFPDELKLARGIPIHKKGDVMSLDNYRTVACLSIFSKIFERLMYSRLMNYITSEGLLSGCQYGFRPGYSACTAAVDLVQYVSSLMDNNRYVVGLFFDLSKAFDSVNVTILSEKLRRYGVRGVVGDWIVSFLTNRRLFVEVAGARSDVYGVDLGTPQGSVLGPLLFILFINDLPSYITAGRVFIYADDTTVIIDSGTPAGLRGAIDAVLSQFKAWCDHNRILLNSTKTVYVEFYNKMRSPLNMDIDFDGTQIAASEKVRFLGTVVDRHLSWGCHIDYTCKKLGSAFFALSILKKSFRGDALLPYYYASVHSILRYSVSVWGQAVDWKRAFILQKRIIRLMFDLPYGTSCRGYFACKKIMTLVSLYILDVLVYTHERRGNYMLHSDVHMYGTRGAERIYLERERHTFQRKAPVNAGCRLYNLLPPSFIGLPIALFRSRLKRLLSTNVFYTLNEFENYISAMTDE